MLKTIPKPGETTWTDEQWQAITARGQDILVAAAAGSGKTAVLVERIIRRITEKEDPVDVDRLLIATFTNAAAAEMKKRIGEAIEKELGKHPDSLFLRRQLSLLNRASISTLHSFCMEVIRRYYYKLDLDPKFRIADSTEAELLREEVLDELFEEQYGREDNDDFYTLVECFSNDRSDQDLQNLVLKLYDFSRSHPFPGKWVEQMASKYGAMDDAEESEDFSFWTSEILADIRLQLQGLQDLLQQGMNITGEPAGPAPYAENLEQDLHNVISLSHACENSWEATYQVFQGLNYSRLKPCSGVEYDQNLQKKVKDLRNQVKKHLNAIKEEMFMRPLTDYFQDLRKMAPMMHTLADLIKEFDQRYMNLKQQKGLVDFADLEHYCLDILRNPDSSADQLLPSEAALDYRRQFVEVLVDEYQDTNLVQESILKLVTGGNPGGNLFMVGDVKQSIYRFRLAEPGLFLSKYKSFAVDKRQDAGDTPEEHLSKQPENQKGLRIDLARNFRSRAEVLSGTNYLFKQIMNESVGEIEYDQDAELKLGASYPASDGMQVELMVVDRLPGSEVSGQEDFENYPDEEESNEASEGQFEGKGEDPSDRTELEAVQLEARLMADKIKALIGRDGQPPFQVYDNKREVLRPVQYRDIVILLRAASGWAPTILEEFKQQGIPAYAELSTGYFDAMEVAVMMSLLKVIDNPFQDIPLASVLRSPIVGLDGNELAQIRMDNSNGSFYEAFRVYLGNHRKEEGNSALYVKLKTFGEKLEKWRTRARQGSLSDLIWQIYRETGYFDFVGGMPAGNQRQANLRALYDRARQYESTSFRGLFRFLRFIERMRDRGSDLGTARALGEQEDVVRVMTIHKSKGLEFPVVFIAGLGKMFNMRDLNSKFLLHKELGLGSKYIDSTLRISYPTLPQLSIRRRMHMELLAEEMRVLYVALTRAKEKLYLIGTVKDGERKLEQWEQHLNFPKWMLADYERTKARCYLDWVGPALVRHKDALVLRRKNNGKSPVGNTRENYNREIHEHSSSWLVSFIDPQTLQEANKKREQPDETVQEAIANWQPVHHYSEYQSYVNDTLSWKYAYPSAQDHMAKQSVTELKRQKEWFAEDGNIQLSRRFQSPIADRPRFLQTTKMTAAERGTAAHLVMQHISLKGPLSMQEIQNHVGRMVETELLTEEQAEEIDIHSISMFFESELGQRIFQSGQVKRETPFSLAIPASEVFADWLAPEDETVLVQGVIDCVLEDEDGLVLIDYKTDAVSGRFENGFEEARPILIERYQLQLDIYAKAIERIWNRPVKEKYLYFFDGGYLIRLD
jgi:ATP-dependent helicase/nuclease subunit A